MTKDKKCFGNYWRVAGNAAAVSASGSTHFERNIRALAVLELQENQRRQAEESSGTHVHSSQSQQHFNPSYSTQRYYQQSHYTGIEVKARVDAKKNEASVFVHRRR